MILCDTIVWMRDFKRSTSCESTSSDLRSGTFCDIHVCVCELWHMLTLKTGRIFVPLPNPNYTRKTEYFFASVFSWWLVYVSVSFGLRLQFFCWSKGRKTLYKGFERRTRRVLKVSFYVGEFPPKTVLSKVNHSCMHRFYFTNGLLAFSKRQHESGTLMRWKADQENKSKFGVR